MDDEEKSPLKKDDNNLIKEKILEEEEKRVSKVEEIGRTSSEILKNIKKHKKADTRIPPYWRQRETRRRQISIPAESPPKLRKKIVDASCK